MVDPVWQKDEVDFEEDAKEPEGAALARVKEFEGAAQENEAEQFEDLQLHPFLEGLKPNY